MNDKFSDEIWRYTEFQILRLRSETDSLLAEIDALAGYLEMDDDDEKEAKRYMLIDC